MVGALTQSYIKIGSSKIRCINPWEGINVVAIIPLSSTAHKIVSQSFEILIFSHYIRGKVYYVC